MVYAVITSPAQHTLQLIMRFPHHRYESDGLFVAQIEQTASKESEESKESKERKFHEMARIHICVITSLDMADSMNRVAN